MPPHGVNILDAIDPGPLGAGDHVVSAQTPALSATYVEGGRISAETERARQRGEEPYCSYGDDPRRRDRDGIG
jgi:hypothetical protein